MSWLGNWWKRLCGRIQASRDEASVAPEPTPIAQVTPEPPAGGGHGEATSPAASGAEATWSAAPSAAEGGAETPSPPPSAAQEPGEPTQPATGGAEEALCAATPVQSEATPSVVLPAPRTPRRRTRLVVGFDYGTCFTKILTRVRGDKQAQVLVIDPPVEGAPPFVSHSLVGETSDGCLYFGARVLRENCRHVHRSLKVKLLPPRNAPPDRRRVRTEGDVRVDVLVAAYLTWALNEVVRALDQEHGVDGYTATLNVAAPMDHYGDAALRDRYLRILQAAWSASFGSTHFEIEQGVSAREVRNWALPLLEPHIPIERPETRLFEILPETIAPLVSLSLDPRMGPGQYLLVDVGAGTTEMSINRAGERGADQSVLCYFDQSIFLGVDDFERDPQELHGRDGHISKLCKAARRTWTLGYQKDAPNHHVRKNWKELTVLLAGGGCMRADVRAALEESSPLVMWGPAGGTNYRLKSHRPHAIRLGGRQQEHDSLQLLAVAHGLSVPRQEWPRFFPPGDVAPLSSTQTVERPPTDWYLYG